MYSRQFTLGAQEAADWLTANAPGNAVLAGAPGKSYVDGGEVATLSGRPTLLGWWNAHENLWRTKQPDAHAAIQTRLRDLETLYTLPDPVAVRALLTQYGVTYIIWGPSEQQTYPTASTATLERVATRVHDANGWALFHVVP